MNDSGAQELDEPLDLIAYLFADILYAAAVDGPCATATSAPATVERIVALLERILDHSDQASATAAAEAVAAVRSRLAPPLPHEWTCEQTRRSAGLTPAQLGELVGVTGSQIRRWESRRRPTPLPANARRYRQVLEELRSQAERPTP